MNLNQHYQRPSSKTWDLDDHNEAENHELLDKLDKLELEHLLDEAQLHCCPDVKETLATELLGEAAEKLALESEKHHEHWGLAVPSAQGPPVSAGEVEAAKEQDLAASGEGELDASAAKEFAAASPEPPESLLELKQKELKTQQAQALKWIKECFHKGKKNSLMHLD